MAEKNIAALLDSMAYTIHVQYQHTTSDTDAYVYVCNLPEIDPGDFVIVPTSVRGAKTPKYAPEYDKQVSNELYDQAMALGQNMRLSIARVVAIDQHVDIEPDDDIEYKWVVSKVDLTAYTKLLARNKEITNAVQQAYQRNIRKSFAERILGELPTDEKDNLLKLLNK